MSEPSADYVGRGGLKLEAALRMLGGSEKLKGCNAIDIGASTGGFTECLLRRGATKVTAIDVGHDQLHAKLRADPRVVSLERTNFKTVSLKVAPGPFDYFVIDVSFVAARTMLRPLGFRLRPGAEGVILVKPQFELPDEHVRDGTVKSERLRQWALQRVRTKGEELGFQMLSHVDSPVEVESGTVEVLTRWRFNGPKGKLVGEKAAPAAKPAAASPVPAPVAATAPVPAQSKKPEGERPKAKKPFSKTPYDQKRKRTKERHEPRIPAAPQAKPAKKPVGAGKALLFEVPPIPQKPKWRK